MNALVCLTVAATVFALQLRAVEFTESDAKAALAAATGLVKACTPRNAGTIEGRLAANWIRTEARRAGADAVVDVFTARVYSETAQFANVVAEFPAARPEAPWIVVMSHFDTAPNVGAGFEGANDGASTSGLLIALADALRRETGPRRYNVMLAWTDAEECRIAYGPHDGFQGSRHLLQTFKRKGRTVRAAICLDMLGDRDLNIELPANTTPFLAAYALMAARRAGIAHRVAVRDTIVVKDDHSAFYDAGLPAIDLIDFAYGSAPGRNDYWHTPKDTLDKISAGSLLASGRLVAELLNLL